MQLFPLLRAKDRRNPLLKPVDRMDVIPFEKMKEFFVKNL